MFFLYWFAWFAIQRSWLRRKHSDSDSMGSISAIPYAQNVPLLLSSVESAVRLGELFNESSLPVSLRQLFLSTLDKLNI